MAGPRILVIDGYPEKVRKKLVKDGATVAADLYVATLKACRSDVLCEIVYSADPGVTLPSGSSLGSYDGAVWTGSVVSVTNVDDPAVRQQIELTRAVFEAGVPGFGSCFAIQIATVAAGGTVVRNPKGRELGIGRDLRLTEAGRAHPVFAGRADVFEAAMIHEDMVESLPTGGVVLVENDMCPVQAATFPTGPTGSSIFTGVQYHPEFHLAELGAIMWRQRKALMREGFYADEFAVRAVADDLIALGHDHGRTDLRAKIGVQGDLLDDRIRLNEVHNWVNILSSKT